MENFAIMFKNANTLLDTLAQARTDKNYYETPLTQEGWIFRAPVKTLQRTYTELTKNELTIFLTEIVTMLLEQPMLIIRENITCSDEHTLTFKAAFLNPEEVYGSTTNV